MPLLFPLNALSRSPEAPYYLLQVNATASTNLVMNLFLLQN